MFRYDASHGGLQCSDAFRNWAEAKVCSYFEVLPGVALRCRPLGCAIKIGIASFGEFGPIAAQQFSEMFTFVCGFPVGRKRIGQKEELFTVVRSESRTSTRIDVASASRKW